MRLLLILIIISFCGVYCTDVKELLKQYSSFKLQTNLNHLSDGDKKMLPYLFKAADIIDSIFWFENFGNKNSFLSKLTSDEYQYALINYGPWDKLNSNEPFVSGYGKRIPGVNFYPDNITPSEFDNWENPNKTSWYTVVRRDKNGDLYTRWYHEEYPKHIENIARLLEHASNYATDKGFRNYLRIRAKALRSDIYFDSDVAWMDLKTNNVDFVVGPIETYADQFKGIKAAHNAQILIKDLVWSKNIEKYNAMLPELQMNLPVPDEYKKEATSTGDMFVYYLIYCRGDPNWGPKNIAINLPNDPNVQKIKGSRKIQLKNAIQAKFERILIPMANLLIDESQLKHIVFENGFFQNTMFHEIAHGLGVKFLINSNTSVRAALQELYSPLEEAKADITGVFFIQYLIKHNIIELDIMDTYTSYLAGILRSVRFGASSAHGKANMISYNYLNSKGGFSKSSETGKYVIDKEKMDVAVSELVNRIIVIQGNGDKEKALEFINKYGNIKDELQQDLNKVSKAGIPKDIVFDQDIDYVGLKPVKF